MKKVILILAAAMLVVSGVAAVSAYEAHVVNVSAHVELALDTPGALIIGGTSAFPQEWLEGEITVATSTSFKGLARSPMVTTVDFKVCAQPKDAADLSPDADEYIWAGGFTFVSADGTNWSWIGPTADESPPGAPVCVAPVITFTVTDIADEIIYVGMDMPVFDSNYIAATDVTKPRPALADCGVLADEPCVTSAGVSTGEYYGLDLIIQVTDIR